MVNRRISDDLKECALSLWDNGLDLEDICEALSVSKSSCYRWRKITEDHENVNPPPSPLVGRTREIIRVILGAIKQLYSEDPDIFLDEIYTWLAVEHGIWISTSRLSRNLNDAGLTRKVLQELALEQDEAQREEFKQMLRTYFVGDGSEFVVVGESSKSDHTYAWGFGRASQGQRAEICDVLIRGTRYSLCAAMTTDGYFAARVMEGSYDADQFYDFVAEDVLPNMKPYPQERSVIVLDNCRTHHNQDLINLVEAAGCLILFLPPYSPDLTPIEESFSAVIAYIRRHGHELRLDEDPTMALLEATGCITAEKARGWFQNAGYIVTE